MFNFFALVSNSEELQFESDNVKHCFFCPSEENYFSTIKLISVTGVLGAVNTLWWGWKVDTVRLTTAVSRLNPLSALYTTVLPGSAQLTRYNL